MVLKINGSTPSIPGVGVVTLGPSAKTDSSDWLLVVQPGDVLQMELATVAPATALGKHESGTVTITGAEMRTEQCL